MRSYGRIVAKRWRVIAVFAAIGLGVGIWQWAHAAPAYRASSEVLIERPSGYVISASVGGLGTATSTKQQMHFVESDSFQSLARALTDLAPIIHLDLTDQAELDDISTVIQTDVLNSDYVTPVRLVLYDLPAPSLLSFQQARTLTEAPALARGLRSLTRLAKGDDFDITLGWMRGRPGPSDRAVWDNLLSVANSPFVGALQSLGVTDDAARDVTSTTDEQNMPNEVTGARLVLATRTLNTLSELDTLAKTDIKRPGRKNIKDLPSTADFLTAAGEIMTSSYVAELPDGPGKLEWTRMSPADRQQAIVAAHDALWLQKRKHPSKSEGVWAWTGKEAGDGTDVIAVTQTAPTAVQARLAANAMAAVMVWEDRMTKVAEAERSVRFLTAQLGDETSGATQALRDKEDALTRYRKSSRLLDLDTELKAEVQYAVDLEADQGKAEVGIRESQAALGKTLKQLGGSETWNIAPTIRGNPIFEGLKSDLIKGEAALASLRGNGYTDEWPAVQAQLAQIKSLKASYDAEARTSIEKQFMPDPVHQALAQRAASLAADLAGLDARKIAITRLLGAANGRFAGLPDKQAEMVRLLRAYTLAERQYMDLYGRLIDAKNNRAMRQGNARVVQVALEPGEKVSPRKKTIILGMLVGIFMGVLCALALASTDTHIRTVDDVRRELDVPVLAHLPAIPSGNALVVESSPVSAVTEAFRGLRSTIRFMGGETPLKTLAITSTRSAEGKSTVVANLAASLAQAGLVITAVDADMRRPRLSQFFGVPNTSGLSDALSGDRPAREARTATRIPGLYLVPAGPAAANSGELMENGRIGRALKDLSDDNDMVLVDTPPVSVVADAALVGSAADATILVIEAGAVGPDEARAAIAKLTQQARANLIGVVLVGGDAPVSADYVRYVKPAEAEQAAGPGGTRKPR
jgi:capsular exopolysaccharide synthesis family protein